MRYAILLDQNKQFIAHPTENVGSVATDTFYDEMYKQEKGHFNYTVQSEEMFMSFRTNETTGWKIGEVMVASEQIMERVTNDVQNGVRVSSTAIEQFNQILTRTNEVTPQVEEISETIQDIAASVQEATASANELAHIANDNASASESVVASVQEQLASMEEISSSAQELSRMAEELQASSAKFKY